MPLEPAQNQPLTIAKLQAQLNRLGGTPFHGGQITVDLAVDAILPISELNRLRRSVLEEILSQRRQPPAWHLSTTASWADLLPPPTLPPVAPVQLHVLVRSLEQLQGALDRGIGQIYGEFSNPADYRTAGDMTRDREFFAVPPRITKPGEHWTLTQLASSHPAGYVVRNYDQLAYFRGQRSIGDFSLNIANGLTGQYFHSLGLERLTAAYDLNISQMLDLVSSDPTLPWEVTLHQHMPMFHMEHCVFCAFLSDGHDYRDCGRPCDRHQVTLQDRVGSSHILQADVGCRNTVFNSVAQTGAEYWQVLVGAGVRHFRLELLREDQGQTRATIQAYQDLLASRITGRELWQRLQLRHQLGVTRGTLGG
jgi:U32 family peptidase